MSALKVVAELGERSAWFAGDRGVIEGAVKMARCKRQWDVQRHALAVPRAAADDVMVALEFRFGVVVEIVEAIA